ncbi:hypothetical protein ACFL2Q_06195 [Thermodesulfobacteriota bacterium]
MTGKAVALISGGLDSALAIHLVKAQGIDVTAVHFTAFFNAGNPELEDSAVMVTARQLGVPVILEPRGHDFIEVIRNPRFGHGKNINPCIDCRIYSFIKTKTLMEEIGASFMVTGEVVGQRPMSQRRDAIGFIERKSGCSGIVVRPLSGKLLPPTLPEKAGIIDRDKLLDIAGRGRKTQLALAREIGLTGYQTPAGGCLLTDKNFSNRLRDLLEDKDDVLPEELDLLGVGRHLRIRPGLKIVVGRKEAENKIIQGLAQVGILLSPAGFPGPVVLAQGSPDSEEEALIGSIIRRYSKEATRGEQIRIVGPSSQERQVSVTSVADDEWISEHMI